jgi:hypothetical protein
MLYFGTSVFPCQVSKWVSPSNYNFIYCSCAVAQIYIMNVYHFSVQSEQNWSDWVAFCHVFIINIFLATLKFWSKSMTNVVKCLQNLMIWCGMIHEWTFWTKKCHVLNPYLFANEIFYCTQIYQEDEVLLQIYLHSIWKHTNIALKFTNKHLSYYYAIQLLYC